MRPCLWCLWVLWSTNLFANDWIERLLLSDTAAISKRIYSNPDKYKLQIIVTTIERDPNGYPILSRCTPTFNSSSYFYPASLYKFPISCLAIEKIRSLNKPLVDLETGFYCQSSVCKPLLFTLPTDQQPKYPSLADHIKASLVYSDNYSPKYIQEFLGKEFSDKWLKNWGLRDTHIRSFPSSNPPSSAVEKWAFWNENIGWVLEQAIDRQPNRAHQEPILVGQKSYCDGKIIPQPWDFSADNQIALKDLHLLMESILFPELNLLNKTLFTSEDLHFLKKTLSTWPRNCQIPTLTSGDLLPDNFRKYLYIGDLNKDSIIPSHFLIANKVGQAYGFLTDVSYYHQKISNTEVLISATLYVNENEIINDGVYQYESLGIPFLARLGRVVLMALDEKKKWSNLKVPFY